MITTKPFEVFDGQQLYAYTLSDDIEVTILTLGATVLSLRVHDKTGAMLDVALGMTDVKSLLTNGTYMGAIVGRCANRIAKGKFTLNGQDYQITANNGVNHLHGGMHGFSSRIFDVVEIDELANSITLCAKCFDGDDGYPANIKLLVQYTVSGNSLVIDYYAKSDGDTLCNPTNHAYFNLNGENDGNAMDNLLYINADSYLQIDECLIPTNCVYVSATPFDFRAAKPIGKDIASNDIQLRIAGGYDHCFCLNGEHAATAYSPKSGVMMDVVTDMPGMQLYTGNFLDGEKGKSIYGKRSGFCLETQFYPNAINRDDCAKPILKKGEEFHSQTRYVFCVKG